MKHLNTLSKMPVKAQTGLCENFESDLQVKLCFLIQILTEFVLPAQGKSLDGTDTTV